MEAKEILREYFGYEEFRAGQEEVIARILAGQDALCVMPTGAGKSLCYQIPALLLPGVTLVVSPLISLMQDQVAALVQAGVKAAYLNSSLTPGQCREMLRRAAAGAYKIIYVAPERLLTPSFLSLVSKLTVSLLTVDEAHCVSQWGQDFRPSYLQIAQFVRALPQRPTLAAFTATATDQVRQDIVAKLELQQPYRRTLGFDRANLYFEVRRPRRKMPELLAYLADKREKSGIVYCATRKTVETVCGGLLEAGYAAAAYHAGLPDAERARSQQDFLYDRKRVMVATNAFGMGIDKSNVSFVVHYNMPKNIESYYQEAGRAGRDGEAADCLLLYSPQDLRTNQILIESSAENSPQLDPQQLEQQRRKDYQLLKQMTAYCTTTHCLRSYILRYFGEEAAACGHCGNCQAEYEEVEITQEAQKILSCVAGLAQQRRSYGKVLISDVLHGSATARIRELRLEQSESYGLLAALSVRRIRDLIDYLSEQGYLEVDAQAYNTIRLGAKAGAILQQGQPLLMRQAVVAAESQAERAEAATQSPQAADENLFGKLKRLRTELAQAESVPAYIIFSDAALRDMCRVLPQDLSSFLQVSGVGQVKMQRYGAAFTELIRAHLREA